MSLISRKSITNYFKGMFTQYIGDWGYDERPYYGRPGTTGNLYSDRVHAPVWTSVEFASRFQENYVREIGDVLRWLDACPRGEYIRVPNYHGSTADGEWRYYKDRRGQWHFCGYVDFGDTP